MPGLLEISGLDQAPDDSGTKPATIWGIPWNLLIGGAVVIGGGVAFWFWYRDRGRSFVTNTLSSLGIIEPCRTKDRDPRRPARSQKWCLRDSKGQKVLGRHSSRSGAQRQERAIQMRKHR